MWNLVCIGPGYFQLVSYSLKLVITILGCAEASFVCFGVTPGSTGDSCCLVWRGLCGTRDRGSPATHRACVPPKQYAGTSYPFHHVQDGTQDLTQARQVVP